jgi:hypothetical protein
MSSVVGELLDGHVFPRECQQLMTCRFVGFYKDIGAVLYPVLPDLSELVSNTNRLLEGRRREGGVYRPNTEGLVKPFGMSLPFLSLLFAVLAAGCQLSDLSGRDRELTSWIYGLCPFAIKVP